MARQPRGVDRNILTIVARRVLLDALAALDSHRSAVVLVGAQAVYQHTIAAELGVAAYTSDGDLGLDPARVNDAPLIEQAMRDAGFTRDHPYSDSQSQPGIWWKQATIDDQDLSIEVDLLVPAELAGGSPRRRGVAIGPHDRNAVRRVPGLAVAMEDYEPRTITSLEPDHDPRTFRINVAGVAALLIAKGYKLGERLDEGLGRENNKDASDIIGLMIASDVGDTAATLERLIHVDRIAGVTAQGLQYLQRLFSQPNSPGIAMAISALAGVRDETFIRQLAPAYLAQLPS